MSALPLLHINYVSAALSSLALRERAAGRSPSHANSLAAHQLFLQQPHQFVADISDASVGHLKRLSSSASPDGSKTIGKLFDDAQKSFAGTTKTMTDATGYIDPVDEAQAWANELVKRQHRGPGDTVEAAMHRASQAYRIEHQTLWKLRYRKPKDMLLKAYLSVKAAYVDAFDAFIGLVQRFDAHAKALGKREERVQQAEGFQLRTLAAQALDKAWRKRSMVPACPSCSAGLFPEDFKGGVKTMLGRDYAEARRSKLQKPQR